MLSSSRSIDPEGRRKAKSSETVREFFAEACGVNLLAAARMDVASITPPTRPDG
jgi:hypothetical protein